MTPDSTDAQPTVVSDDEVRPGSTKSVPAVITNDARTATPSPVTPPKPATQKPSKVGSTWVFSFLGLVLLILLLVFVLQNLSQVEMTVMVWTFTFPLGVGMLLAAIAGALIMALIGSVRIVQLRRQISKLSKTEKPAKPAKTSTLVKTSSAKKDSPSSTAP